MRTRMRTHAVLPERARARSRTPCPAAVVAVSGRAAGAMLLAAAAAQAARCSAAACVPLRAHMAAAAASVAAGGDGERGEGGAGRGGGGQQPGARDKRWLRRELDAERRAWLELVAGRPLRASERRALTNRRTSSLEATLDVLRAALTRAAADRIVRFSPGLMTLSPLRMQSRLEALRGALRADADGVARVLERAPALLSRSDASLSASVGALASALPPGADAMRVARAYPTLLCVGARQLESNLGALGVCLRVDAAHARRVALAHPLLLAMAPQTIAANLAALGSALRVQGIIAADVEEEVLRVARACPRYLASSPSALEASAAALRELLPGASVPRVARRARGVLSLPPQSIRERLRRLGEMLRADGDQMAALVSREPQLLTRAPAALEKNLACIAEAFDLSLEEAIAEAMRKPELLRAPGQKLVERARHLGALLGVPPRELNASLLRARTETVERKLASLRR